MSNVKHIKDDTFGTEVIEAATPVLVDFYADWCAPCKAIAPVVDEIAEEFGDALRVVKVDVDESPQVPATYGVQSIPTLILFAGGEEVERWRGLRGKDELITAIREHVGTVAAR